MGLEKRQYRRFRLPEGRLIGMLNGSDAVEVVDMSVGGAALKSGQRLSVGGEYTIKLGSGDGGIAVQGVIIRSRMISVWETFHGARVPVYTSAVRFQGEAEEQIADFLCGTILS